MINEYDAVDVWKLAGKTDQAPLYSPQIPHDLTWDQ
jgi:hypothetical protein